MAASTVPDKRGDVDSGFVGQTSNYQRADGPGGPGHGDVYGDVYQATLIEERRKARGAAGLQVVENGGVG